jgi:hypothetical protein
MAGKIWLLQLRICGRRTSWWLNSSKIFGRPL